MIHLTLTRIKENEHGTFGILQVPDRDIPFYTLEPPWKDNQTDISCIPAGTYYVTPWHSPRHGWCFKIWNVPGREDVLIHIGNWLRDTLGCILVGEEATNDMLLRSRLAIDELHSMIGDQMFELTITDA